MWSGHVVDALFLCAAMTALAESRSYTCVNTIIFIIAGRFFTSARRTKRPIYNTSSKHSSWFLMVLLERPLASPLSPQWFFIASPLEDQHHIMQATIRGSLQLLIVWRLEMQPNNHPIGNREDDLAAQSKFNRELGGRKEVLCVFWIKSQCVPKQESIKPVLHYVPHKNITHMKWWMVKWAERKPYPWWI